jgi:hypothetical protein
MLGAIYPPMKVLKNTRILNPHHHSENKIETKPLTEAEILPLKR